MIAGPTASGKSALALKIATEYGGMIINADALQVYDCWRVLTARPTELEEEVAPHRLYGALPCDAEYSVGAWLRDVRDLLNHSETRPIIVGGTGLYFKALTEGLAEIPATAPEIRARADQLSLSVLLADLDDETRNKIDTENRARVQRAWEVLTQTGKPLIEWQRDTPPPILPLSQTQPIVFTPKPGWLNERIERRFDMMLSLGAIEEVKAARNILDMSKPAGKAIGAKQLLSYLNGEISLEMARDKAVIASRQYAKRQRTWFRSNMSDWHAITDLSTESSTD